MYLTSHLDTERQTNGVLWKYSFTNAEQSTAYHSADEIKAPFLWFWCCMCVHILLVSNTRTKEISQPLKNRKVLSKFFSFFKKEVRDYLKLGIHYSPLALCLSPLVQNCRINTRRLILTSLGWKVIFCICGVHRYSFTRTHIGSLANHWLLGSKTSQWVEEDLLCKSCNHKGFMFLLKALDRWYFLKMFDGNSLIISSASRKCLCFADRSLT